MAWQSIGPNTWVQGRFRLYKSLTPELAYWLSVDGGDPVRCADQEGVKVEIKNILERYLLYDSCGCIVNPSKRTTRSKTK